MVKKILFSGQIFKNWVFTNITGFEDPEAKNGIFSTWFACLLASQFKTKYGED